MRTQKWLVTSTAKLQKQFASLNADQSDLLGVVRAPEGWGVFASIGPNFRHTVFGRDSIEVAEDVYLYDQRLAHDIIFTLARLQGTCYGGQNEEEPGKIHHEYRTTTFADAPVPENCVTIMRKLQETWGDPAEDHLLYYGSYDATPLYLRLLQKYTDRYGDTILSETYTNKAGTTRTVQNSAQIATDWLVNKLRQREDRLLAYRRSNPRGIANQVWKDSQTAYLFSDGTFPDHDKDIVSTELQGYAYDALLYAARIFPTRAKELNALAAEVQHATIDKLWMPNEQYFAQGLGTHQSGGERIIDTLTSNGALILDSKLLADVPEWARDIYISGVEKMILGPEFLTPAGVRCRAKRHADLLPFVDYHGSYAVWAKETADVARGLESYGRRSGATALRRALKRSFREAGEFYELFYVDLDNTAYYNQAEAITRFTSTTAEAHLPVPEPGQAWSISAAIASGHLLPKTPLSVTLTHIRQLPQRSTALTNQLLSPIQSLLKRRAQT